MLESAKRWATKFRHGGRNPMESRPKSLQLAPLASVDDVGPLLSELGREVRLREARAVVDDRLDRVQRLELRRRIARHA
jgi:hypothetical protein